MKNKILKQVILILSIIFSGYYLNLIIGSGKSEVVISTFSLAQMGVLNFVVSLSLVNLLAFPVLISLNFDKHINAYLKQIPLIILFLFLKNDLILFSMPVFLLNNIIADPEDNKIITFIGLTYFLGIMTYLWNLNINYMVFSIVIVYLLSAIRNRNLEIVLIVLITHFYIYNVEMAKLLMPFLGLIFLIGSKKRLRVSAPWILLLAGIDFPSVLLVYVIFILLEELKELINDRLKSFLCLIVYSMILIISKEDIILQILFMGMWIVELIKIEQVEYA